MLAEVHLIYIARSEILLRQKYVSQFQAFHYFSVPTREANSEYSDVTSRRPYNSCQLSLWPLTHPNLTQPPILHNKENNTPLRTYLFENLDGQDDAKEALGALKYMLLC
jgi:hypothetical protein